MILVSDQLSVSYFGGMFFPTAGFVLLRSAQPAALAVGGAKTAAYGTCGNPVIPPHPCGIPVIGLSGDPRVGSTSGFVFLGKVLPNRRLRSAQPAALLVDLLSTSTPKSV